MKTLASSPSHACRGTHTFVVLRTLFFLSTASGTARIHTTPEACRHRSFEDLWISNKILL
jgi:hypothetical protein